MTNKLEISPDQLEKCLRDATTIRFEDDNHVLELRALLAAPVVERQPVDAILLEDCEEITVQDYGRGYFATDDCARQLYTSPPAPVAVVLPERKQPRPEGDNTLPSTYNANLGWNACLDKVKELNQ